MDILEKIFEQRRQDLALVMEATPLARLEAAAYSSPVPASFVQSLRNPNKAAPRLIAEIKRRSPSKGILNPDVDPTEFAKIYSQNGAAAISVLTEERNFGGSLTDLTAVAKLNLGLPLLRKDFLFDHYQLMEARISGASAVLLIAAYLDLGSLKKLIRTAQDLELAPLVEVHNETELEKALAAEATIIGINNRDLRDFSVSLQTSFDLRQNVLDDYLTISESGIHTPEDAASLAEAGFDAILVGERLMTADDIPAATRLLSRHTDVSHAG